MFYNLKEFIGNFFEYFKFNRSDFTGNNTFFGSKQPVRSYVAGFVKRTFHKTGVIQSNGIIIFHKLAGNLAEDNVIAFQVGQNHCRPFL